MRKVKIEVNDLNCTNYSADHYNEACSILEGLNNEVSQETLEILSKLIQDREL